MNDLIYTPPGEDTPARMNSVEIADLCGKRHDNARRTIETLAESGVISLPQFEEVKIQRERRVETVMAYVFVGEKGKRDSIVVIAQLSPEFTAALVDRWQEIEKRIARPSGVIDMRDAKQLRIAAIQLIEMNQEKDERIAKLEPKAEAMALLESSEGSVGPRLAAKMLNMPERKFTAWLVTNRWAFRQNGIGPLQAYADKRSLGYLEHRPHTYRDHVRGEDRTIAQMMITPKGLARLAAVFGCELKDAA